MQTPETLSERGHSTILLGLAIKTAKQQLDDAKKMHDEARAALLDAVGDDDYEDPRFGLTVTRQGGNMVPDKDAIITKLAELAGYSSWESAFDAAGLDVDVWHKPSTVRHVIRIAAEEPF